MAGCRNKKERFMRRFALASLVAVMAGVAMAATTSGASFDRHFTVISKFVSGEERRGAFHFKLRLLDELDHSDKVGNARARCNQERRKIRCRVLVHLNGEVGGRGDLVVKGNEGRGDNTFLVVNGSGDFDGVAGKMTIHPEPGAKDRFHFDLVR
jgi:hypothetical protein